LSLIYGKRKDDVYFKLLQVIWVKEQGFFPCSVKGKTPIVINLNKQLRWKK
jgi:hypothetical protein